MATETTARTQYAFTLSEEERRILHALAGGVKRKGAPLLRQLIRREAAARGLLVDQEPQRDTA